MDQIELENPLDEAPKNFTDALREKYGTDQDDEPSNFSFIIVSPKRRNSSKDAELGHLKTVVLNDMRLKNAGIPKNGLSSLCPNIVDLDLQNNHFSHWSELLAILTELKRVKYVNLSQNFLRLDCANNLPDKDLSVENLVLNSTNIAIADIVKLSNIMPVLKELHLCGNNYFSLGNIEEGIMDGSLSSIECLRLNNNNINSWGEVWKLKDMPFLKNLILSGNPLAHIFYSFDSDSKISTCKPNEFRTSSPFPFDNKAVQSDESEKEAMKNLEACHLDDKNIIFHDDQESSISGHIDSDDIELEFKDISFSTLEFDEDDRDGRPFSRFARHDDSVFTDEDDDMSEKCFVSEYEGNRNFNNSGREMQERCQFEGADDAVMEADFFASVDFDAAVEAAVLESVHHAQVSIQEENDTWHKAVAEAFLHEIIENLVVDSEMRVSSSTTSPIPACSCTSSSIVSPPASPMSFSSQPSSVSSLPSTCISVSSQPGVAALYPHEIQRETFNSSVEEKDLSAMQSQLHGKNDEEKSNSNVLDDVKTTIKDCMQSFTTPEKLSDGIADDFESSTIVNFNQNAICIASKCESEKSNNDVIKTELNVKNKNELSTMSMGTDSLRIPVNRSLFVSKRDSLTEAEFGQSAKSPIADKNDQVCKDTNTNQKEKHVNSNKLTCDEGIRKLPFSQLTSLCLSEARISHWSHLHDLRHYPKLTHIRMLENPLYKDIIPEDRRKLYVSSLPTIKYLNGSEVTETEREKAERHYLRYFMDHEEKPDFFQPLVAKHGPPVKLVEIDLSAGFKDSFMITFVLEEDLKNVATKGKTCFTKRIQNSGIIGELRKIVSKEMGLRKSDFVMVHHQCGPSHPEHERDIIELRCEGLPISRFDFADGDEIHLKAKDSTVIFT